MGDGSGTASASPGRARALWVRFRSTWIYRNRTKVTGYVGVVAGAVQMARLEGQGWSTCALGALVALIGHYNDTHVGEA